MAMRNAILISVLIAIYLSGCTNTNSPLRPELETFQRSDDYDYGLSDLAGAGNHSLTLTEDGFQWPAIATAVDTVLLEISLQRTSGQNPAIGIDAGGVKLIQYFEQGGRGRRYLDLSPVLKGNIEPGDFIEDRKSGV